MEITRIRTKKTTAHHVVASLGRRRMLKAEVKEDRRTAGEREAWVGRGSCGYIDRVGDRLRVSRETVGRAGNVYRLVKRFFLLVNK